MTELTYNNILVPVDGSKESEAAFKKSVQVALRNGSDAHLHILHVIDTRSFQSVTDFQTTMIDQVAETAKETLDRYLAEAKEAGVENVKYTIEYGSPKAIIAEEAPKEYNIDLIMLGATGLNTIERLLIGSVADYVVRTSKVDTLVVRAED